LVFFDTVSLVPDLARSLLFLGSNLHMRGRLMAGQHQGHERRTLARILPGERHRDDDLIVRSVIALNRLYVTGGLTTALKVGEYILGSFFGGDPAAFHSRSRDHASFRGLVSRADLQLSGSYLYKCVAVREQFDLLPSEVQAGLSFSHQVALLPAKDPELKQSLAKEALRKQLTVPELHQEVREHTRPEDGRPRTGRPPLHPLVRRTRMIDRALNGMEPDILDKGLIDDLTYEDGVAVRTSLESSIQQLAALRRKLEHRA